MANVIKVTPFNKITFTHFFIVLSVLFLAYGMITASAGFLTTDEFIYTVMTDRLVKDGSLFFDNGYLDIPSKALQLWFLNPTPKGLTPQYPSGFAFITAPFYMIGGVRGIILLNTLAVLGMVLMTYRLAKLLYENENLAFNAALILSLASFLCDYAFSILPHAASGFCVLVSVYYMAASVLNGRKPDLHAFLAGLVIGIGVHLRVDTILAAPLLAVWIMGSASNPFRKALFFGTGMVPGIAAASWLNFLKYGTLNPFTYARTDGLTSFSSYSELTPYIILGVLAVTALGFSRVRKLFRGFRGGIILGVGLLCILLVPQTQALAVKLFKGLYVLLLDMQSYDYVHRLSGNPIINDGRLILFSGQVKKALFESLPYAGFIAIPLSGIFRRQSRAASTLLALLPVGWFAFFSINQWHGGQSTNLRYFTPMLPFLAILTAAAWQRMCRQDSNTPPTGKVLLFLVLLPLPAYVIPASYYQTPLFSLLISGTVRLLFYAGLSLSILILIRPQTRIFLSIGRGFLYATLTMAFINGYLHDLKTSRDNRNWYMRQKADCTGIENDALVISQLPRLYACHLMRGGGQLALYQESRNPLDTGLIDWNLNHNRPVYTDSHTVQQMKGESAARNYVFSAETDGKLFRINRRDSSPIRGIGEANQSGG